MTLNQAMQLLQNNEEVIEIEKIDSNNYGVIVLENDEPVFYDFYNVESV